MTDEPKDTGPTEGPTDKQRDQGLAWVESRERFMPRAADAFAHGLVARDSEVAALVDEVASLKRESHTHMLDAIAARNLASHEATRFGIAEAERDSQKRRREDADEALSKLVDPLTGHGFFSLMCADGDAAPVGWVATFGGPYDSYTLCERDGDGNFMRFRFDHDEGQAREWEALGVVVMDENEDAAWFKDERDTARTRLAEVEAERDVARKYLGDATGQRDEARRRHALDHDRLTAELEKAKTTGPAVLDGDDIWRWMGDDLDHPESLTCPVLMKADQVREFVKARTELAEARGEVERLRAKDADGEHLLRIVRDVIPIEDVNGGRLSFRCDEGTRISFCCGPSGRLNMVVIQHGPDVPSIRELETKLASGPTGEKSE